MSRRGFKVDTGSDPHGRPWAAQQEGHGRDEAIRKHRYALFPCGYGQQACKPAGKHKPLKPLLDL
jgi:tRNA 2-thiouridine synthesizing protein E